MLLAIDIGNTNIHLGLWRDGAWNPSWRARTVHEKMADEYGVLVRNFLNSAGLGFDAVDSVVMSSVVPILTGRFAELVERYIHVQPLIVTHEVKLCVKVAIDIPAQAGPDRLANAAAACHLFGGPAVVIDFGTSTNFDVVSADGKYIGGAIAPGIGLAHDALVSRAARLHKVDLVPPPNAIGRNTIHAMQSGIFWGYVGLIEGILTRIKNELDSEDTKVIATGGLATLFEQHVPGIDIIASELTLDGLRIIYELNAGH
ncbi:MAG: type III pantothenate kinase [Chloroflexi bacterium]|nr:MAG: type III pantothenate kinase [Chloroflexota bacterium]